MADQRQDQREDLQFDPPAGQDPVTVVTALRRAGLEAGTVLVAGRGVVRIATSGADPRAVRETAREVIGRDAAWSMTEGKPGPPVPVRFSDEPEPKARG